MNNIDKTIFSSYEAVETALLNDLATEARTKGKKARTLKGEGYYVKYDGTEYDITSEQSRMYNLIRNNYNHFVEQLNSARADILGVWKAVWEGELPRIIANLERGIEICQKYFDAFKAYITEGVEENVVEEETEETEEKTETVETAEENAEKNVEMTETSNDETEVETEVVAETNTETCAYKTHTQGQDQDADDCVCKSHTQRQKPEADGFVCDLHTNSTSRTAPRTTKTVLHDDSSRASKNSSQNSHISRQNGV